MPMPEKMQTFFSRYPERKEPVLILELFVVSLLVRVFFLFLMGGDNILINNDEVGYFYRALAFADILKGFDSPGVMNFFYSGGYWPPLHPMALGAAVAMFGSKIIVCRFVTIVVGALTTVMVFKLAALLHGRKTGWLAAVIHLFYPSFVAFSIALWSETIFIFFVITTLYYLARLTQAKPVLTGKTITLSLLVGAMLGFAGLSRAVAVLLVPVLIGFVIWKFKNRYHKLVHAVVILTTCLAIWSPWMIYASRQEGRFVLLSTQLAYNLALGNKEELPRGLGSALANKGTRQDLNKDIGEVAEADSISVDQAARKVALRSIFSDPTATLGRMLDRILLLLTVDYISLRSLFSLQYKPVNSFLAGIMALAFVLSHLLFIAAFLWGILQTWTDKSWKWLSLLLILVSLAGPAMTVASTRHALVAMTIALLFVAKGVTHYAEFFSRQRIQAVVVIVIISIVLPLSAFPMVAANHLKASNCYSSILNPPARLFRWDLVYTDNFHVVQKKTLGPEHEARVTMRDSTLAEDTYRILFPGPPTVLTVTNGIYSPSEKLFIEDNEGYKMAIKIPDSYAEFGEWEMSGLPGLSYKWERSGADSEMLIRKYLRVLKHMAN